MAKNKIFTSWQEIEQEYNISDRRQIVNNSENEGTRWADESLKASKKSKKTGRQEK